MTPAIEKMHGTRLFRLVDPWYGPGWWHHERQPTAHSSHYWFTECGAPPVVRGTAEREVAYGSVMTGEVCTDCAAKVRDASS